MGRSKRMTPNMVLKTWDESDLNLIMLEPLEVQAATVDARVIQIEKFNRTVYAELGLLMLFCETKKLWGFMFDDTGARFKSFESWVCARAPYSRSYALEAKSKMKILKESGTPMDKLTDVTRANIQLLAQLPPALQRDEEVLKDAKLLTEEAFRDKIVREHSEAHIEPKKKMVFDFEATAREVVDEAIAIAMKKWDCSRQAAVEGIFGEFLINNRESDSGHDRTSVREAGQAATV
jgi:hypothetical protein